VAQGFINHMIDPVLMRSCAQELAQSFKDAGVTKILTVETSGVAPSLMTGLELGCPVIYCRSGKRPITMDSFLTTESVSHTVFYSLSLSLSPLPVWSISRRIVYIGRISNCAVQKGGSVSLFVSTEYLRPKDRVLIIDDFLASGITIRALMDLIKQAGATLVGIGALVEKTFEGGRELLGRETAVPIVSLAVIDSMEGDTIVFARCQ